MDTDEIGALVCIYILEKMAKDILFLVFKFIKLRILSVWNSLQVIGQEVLSSKSTNHIFIQ